MLQALKEEANRTLTENGAASWASTGSRCLDLFAAVGALRHASDEDIVFRFIHALAEKPDWAMKILFYCRDIRGGLGERRVFRVLLHWLARTEPALVRKNLALIPEYGRWDDVLELLDTPCEPDAISLIRRQLEADQAAGDQQLSLLAKWLPSINTSSEDTVRRAKHLARALGMSDQQYRKTLSGLRSRLDLLENYLREQDYSFDYSHQPSLAMLKYRKAFQRHDAVRYQSYLEEVAEGKKAMHTGTLMPYDIIAPLMDGPCRLFDLNEEDRRSLDVTWNAMEDFLPPENALAVVDVSGSMFSSRHPSPIQVAVSLGLCCAQHNRGVFHNHFITFSGRPELVEVQGRDITEKVFNCLDADWGCNTDLEAVFRLILDAAQHHNLPQEELPRRLYIISDMEFDACVTNSKLSNFENARAMYAAAGYELPELVFWNVESRTMQVPIRQDDRGVALVSGCTPRLFSLAASGELSPMALLLEIVESQRYAAVSV